MPRKTITVFICHRHKILDHIYIHLFGPNRQRAYAVVTGPDSCCRDRQTDNTLSLKGMGCDTFTPSQWDGLTAGSPEDRASHPGYHYREETAVGVRTPNH
jgi:hypothetical protein